MIEQPVTLLAALLAGLAGSGHCLAMCGGMASLLATRQHNGRPIKQALVYNVGRIASYSIAGFIVGALGQVLVLTSGADSFVANLRLVTAAMLVIAGLVLVGEKRLFRIFEGAGRFFWQRIAPLAVSQLQKSGESPPSVLLLGMLWGWLPCGMTYAMLGTAAFTASPVHAAGLMAAFGLGTLPAMLGTGLAGMHLRDMLNKGNTRRVAGIAMILVGIWTAQPLQFLHAPDPSGQAESAEHQGHHH